MATDSNALQDQEIPIGSLKNLGKYLKFDLVSGFLVFLIALPLCLAISLASGYPAIAGIFTAVIGGLVATFISDSELSIKGPAAGLIVIALGCMNEFGYTGGQDPAADMQAYKMALGVGMAAAAVQILFAIFRTGILGEFFPTAAVHGMLAAIGVIIIAKQIPVAVGLSAKGEPLELLREIPDKLMHMNPEIGLIGAISLLILFGLPLIKNKYVKLVPAQLVVILVAIPLGMYFDLAHDHTYTLHHHVYEVGEQHLVSVPFNILNAITFPDFSGLQNAFAWKWVAMYALIGSLESLLSAKAVDMIDPWKRKTNLDRDLVAVGVGNLIASFIGGLPMISEIVRSRANIDNGARTRFANLFHGLFLLGCVALLPSVIHQIPLAALAAMLIYTGFRLAHPREFVHVFKVGREQFVIYVTTLVAVLATDLLIGVGIGIALKFCIHIFNGAPLKSLFLPEIEVLEEQDGTYRIVAANSVVFSNWLAFRRKIVEAGLVQRHNVSVDLTDARLVDHTVMEKLHELERDFEREGLQLKIIGLDNHQPLSAHPHAARKRPQLPLDPTS
ncbi:SulP family inorganic anion transporter [Blastopirellula sp. JC732]|uniref:SulP family inorganic anion transporter n=1 Tax=Blastopirellula sediminis TaxID=2894196 RepID=A0A9X1MK73_9BACT|nr:SulP family inorganic anion transporter [Blastopirellula sediminis]MCC9608233.1 SulP family inorganic anion transporter [Blastopirellula sediminis]MCC9626974.1 SulP family inorganic anion transporter [Blastopirellula sediminis]